MLPGLHCITQHWGCGQGWRCTPPVGLTSMEHLVLHATTHAIIESHSTHGPGPSSGPSAGAPGKGPSPGKAGSGMASQPPGLPPWATWAIPRVPTAPVAKVPHVAKTPPWWWGCCKVFGYPGEPTHHLPSNATKPGVGGAKRYLTTYWGIVGSYLLMSV